MLWVCVLKHFDTCSHLSCFVSSHMHVYVLVHITHLSSHIHEYVLTHVVNMSPCIWICPHSFVRMSLYMLRICPHTLCICPHACCVHVLMYLNMSSFSRAYVLMHFNICSHGLTHMASCKSKDVELTCGLACRSKVAPPADQYSWKTIWASGTFPPPHRLLMEGDNGHLYALRFPKRAVLKRCTGYGCKT